MRVPSNLARGSLGFSMTPMIDVVFLLIIFFLVSSHLAQQEVQLDLDLPAKASLLFEHAELEQFSHNDCQ